MPSQKQIQNNSFTAGGDFDDKLSISHEVQAPSIEDVLAAARQAIEMATETIANQGGHCGCF